MNAVAGAATPAIAFARVTERPIAHRGLHACGGIGPVENTIAAARAAVARGYGIECDVQLSRDGRAFVFHDDELTRLTGAAGLFSECGAAEIGALRLADGSAVPDLEDFLAAVGGRVPLVIEMKSGGNGDRRLVEAVLQAIRGYAGPLALESFDPAIVAACREAPCPIGLVGPSNRESVDPRALPRCDFLSWNIDQLAAAVRDYPDLPRTVWTVRDTRQLALAAALDAQVVFEGILP